MTLRKSNIRKAEKSDNFRNSDTLEEIIAECHERDKNKVGMRIDGKTTILVKPKNANERYANKWRERYEQSTKY